jgi:hypothetical protein
MIKKIIITLLTLLISIQISAAEYFTPYSKKDIVLETICIGFIMADWAYAIDMSDRYSEGYKELNPILSDQPSKAEIDRYMATMIGIHLLSTWILSDYRDAIQYITIGIEASSIWRSNKIGLRINMGF